MAEILDLVDASFEAEIAGSDTPVLIDFWAEWCAPCRRLAPLIKEIASEYGDRLRVAKVDVDANPAITSKFSIRAMPTLILLKNGTVAGSLVGAQPKDKITSEIDRILA